MNFLRPSDPSRHETIGTEIMKETAKNLGLSEAATEKVAEYFKKVYDDLKQKGECGTKKTDEEKKKFLEESIAKLQGEVDEADKELVAKVITTAYVSTNALY